MAFNHSSNSDIQLKNEQEHAEHIEQNVFRRKRGLALSKLIVALRDFLARDIEILDVGGQRAYWDNIPLRGVRRVRILNYNQDVLDASIDDARNERLFTFELGDGCQLDHFDDKSVDLVHSNSVIEHVGPWDRVKAMADEARRVGQAGWIQTPAWEFPVEPHYRLPAVHWFGQPVRVSAVRLSPYWRGWTREGRRRHVDNINLLTYADYRELFPDASIYVERLMMLPKSYTARWAPPGLPEAQWS